MTQDGKGLEGKLHRDIYFGKEGIGRLNRLVGKSGDTAAGIINLALVEYELSCPFFRDTVRDATLGLFQVLVPDKLCDPVDDTRDEDAVRFLGGLLNSRFAAEGVADAFRLLLVHNPQMAMLIIPNLSQEATDEPYMTQDGKGSEGRLNRDIYFGKEGIRRLNRLVGKSGDTAAGIINLALVEYELSCSFFRDTVRDAVLAVFRSLIPDEQFDPVGDTRQEEAVQHLGELLNSDYAAEGIAEAFSLLFAQNTLSMSTLCFPSVENYAVGSHDLLSE